MSLDQVREFTALIVARAPEEPGVYALVADGEVVYYGAALGGATIRSRLIDVFSGRDQRWARVSHCCWELSRDPMARVAALLEEHRAAHRRMPRCNDNGG